uniref:Uncharacterized protein n=1 Tax=Meloidogyne enterolobii TaxID=390850 RepID=A0A6V7VGQ9_MELEN|nr:unnamed protein product [Meloidogyne enterolobii]
MFFYFFYNINVLVYKICRFEIFRLAALKFPLFVNILNLPSKNVCNKGFGIFYILTIVQ